MLTFLGLRRNKHPNHCSALATIAYGNVNRWQYANRQTLPSLISGMIKLIILFATIALHTSFGKGRI